MAGTSEKCTRAGELDSFVISAVLVGPHGPRMFGTGPGVKSEWFPENIPATHKLQILHSQLSSPRAILKYPSSPQLVAQLFCTSQ